MKKEYFEKKKNIYSAYIWSFLLEIIVTALGITIFSAVMFLTEWGYEYAPVFATVSIALGCFVSSFFHAKKSGEKGFLSGLIIGVTSFLIILVISLIVDSGAMTVNTLFHFIIIMLSSMIGGILGVNKAKNKKYI